MDKTFLRIQIPAALKRQLKQYCLDNDTDMTTVVIDGIKAIIYGEVTTKTYKEDK